jgi:hypothetical protein
VNFHLISLAVANLFFVDLFLIFLLLAAADLKSLEFAVHEPYFLKPDVFHEF